MNKVLRYFFFFLLIHFSIDLVAQDASIKQQHKVKKSETLFGIAKHYSISIEELMTVNPEMKMEGYQLKKGDYINIPFSTKEKKTQPKQAQNNQQQIQIQVKDQVSQKKDGTIRVGVMLPLHDLNGDGRRMIEYYRGLLLACDRLKKDNISIDIRAWNVPIDSDIRTTLLDQDAAKCDLIFGPLYTPMVKPLADFCKKNDIKLVIPFSISGNDVASCDKIFQVYQTPETLNSITSESFIKQFSGYHPIIVDAEDPNSDKGAFTTELRKQLDKNGISYSLTSLRSSDENFAKSFTLSRPNVVIINTGRSPELNTLFQRLDRLSAANINLSVSLFGYTDWFIYITPYQNYFHKYDTYIPTTFYYNSSSNDTRWVEANYKSWFKNDMMYALPHFGLTGFDHGCFFIGGFHKFGKAFTGGKGQSTYRAVQTPLLFKRIGQGGMQNEEFMLIHYKKDKSIDAINF